jgi:hypothetical protein
MASLADFTTQDWYAGQIFTLYSNWTSLAVNQRRTEYERIFTKLCQTASLPKPTLVWINASGGGFSASDWKMEVELNAVQLNPAQDLKQWVSAATTLYHETRHTEQNFLVAVALLAGKLPLPVVNTRAIQTGGDLPTRVSDIIGMPMHVVLQARIQKGTFRDSQIPQVRDWLESKWGRYGKVFDHVQANSDKSGKTYGDYRNLPTEADAYKIEKKVADLIKERIGKTQTDEALSNLAGFFG